MRIRLLVAALLAFSYTPFGYADVPPTRDTAAPAAVADAELAPVEFDSAEAPGVSWPSDYIPVSPPIDLPSRHLDSPSAITFPATVLPAINVQALLDEDEANATWDLPPRMGITYPLDGELAGRWLDAPQGGQLWVAAIVADGAAELRLHVVDADLPPGAELYIYAPGRLDRILGPYSGAGPDRTGEFWTGSVPGDTAWIECYLPDAATPAAPIRVDQIAYMYRALETDDSRAALDCMGDVACYSAWANVSYAVAKMRFRSDADGLWYGCTGTLLAAQNADQTPYFLTSAHCIDSSTEAATLECQWFYQHATCGGSLMTSKYSTHAGLVGTSGESIGADWSLLLLDGVLPTGVYWVGWTTSDPASGTWSVGVHHPDGSWKRYSRGVRRSSSSYPSYHRIEWDGSGAIGSIYYGSSGSGIYREDTQQLFGNCSFGLGEAGCDYLYVDAYYGRFASYYSVISSALAGGSDDAYENNDSCAGALAVSPGTYSNLVVKSVDEDWYRIYLPAGAQLLLTLTFTDSWGNIDAQLYDACGGNVVSSAVGTIDNESMNVVNAGANAYFYLRVFLADDTRATYAMAFTADVVGDISPPQPNPMQFEVAPHAISTTELAMTAVTATDGQTPPVEYFFNASAGAHDSAWQSAANRSYTDSGLTPNTEYYYRVKARDSAVPANETTYSSWVLTAPYIQTPTGITFGTVNTTSIVLNASGTFTNLTLLSSGLYFDSETTGGDGGINAWLQTTTDTATGLTPNTSYTFRAKARNRDAVETVWGPSVAKATLAVLPELPLLQNETPSTLDVDLQPATNPSYTTFAVQCTNTTDAAWNGKYVDATGNPSATAVWRTDAQWAVTTAQGLQPNTQYCFRSKARNLDLVETSFTTVACATTLAASPDAPQLGNATQTSLDLDVQPAGNPAATEFAVLCSSTTDATWNGKYVNAAGSPSAGAVWQTDALWAVTTVHSLQLATQYCFEVKARNSDLLETVFSAPGLATTTAAVPDAPLLGSATQTTLDLDVHPGLNPPAIELAVLCNNTSDPAWNGKYLDATGNASATAVWRTDAQWAVTTVQSLQLDTQYCFEVKARNGAQVETAFSTQACAATLPSQGYNLGDLNCDGATDVFDVDAFVLALTNPVEYATAYPGCDINLADCNQDGTVDVFDIDAFVTLVIGS